MVQSILKTEEQRLKSLVEKVYKISEFQTFTEETAKNVTNEMTNVLVLVMLTLRSSSTGRGFSVHKSGSTSDTYNLHKFRSSSQPQATSRPTDPKRVSSQQSSFHTNSSASG